MSIPNFVINATFKNVGAVLGGPVGAAIGGMTAGTAIASMEVTELGLKIYEGRATFHDIFRATAAVEAGLAAHGILLGALGIATAPSTLVLIAVGSASIFAAYYKNQTASNDAIYAMIEGLKDGDQPWEIAKSVANAYGNEVERQRLSTETIDQSRRLFQESQFTSPLILDLDGNGVVATTGLGSGTFFDHDGNGLAESTGWVGSGDALLVRDLNGNGRIDDGNELFGNQTDLVNGTNAANGFAALATLDANGDGQVNAQDGSGWSSLRLWRDLNGNGVSEAGELLSLLDAGISSLGTAYSGNANPTDAQGNQHRQLGSFTRTDGSTGAMHDVWFAADPVIQRDANPIEVSETIAALPDMQGLGNVRSLRQAMARACVRSVQRGWDRPFKHEHRWQACAHQPGYEHNRRDQDRAAKGHRIPAQSGTAGGKRKLAGAIDALVHS